MKVCTVKIENEDGTYRRCGLKHFADGKCQKHYRGGTNASKPKAKSENGNGNGVVSDEVVDVVSKDIVYELPGGDELIAGFKEWSERVLIVPEGVAGVAGSPFVLADFQYDFLKGAFADGIKLALLCVARKNGKTACVAAFLLYLLLEVRMRNFRVSVTSIGTTQAEELVGFMVKFLEESPGLNADMLSIRRSPRMVVENTETRGIVYLLSSDKGSGHAQGVDVAVYDELGVVDENHRNHYEAMRTSVRDGRFIALSVRGTSNMLQEILDMSDLEHVHVAHYAMDEGDDWQDKRNWDKANPGLGRVKSLRDMETMFEEGKVNRSIERAFKKFHLNMPDIPDEDTLVTFEEYMEVVCAYKDLPPREGGVVLGIDLGGGDSMSAVCAVWPDSGRCELGAYWPGKPSLREREVRDRVRVGTYEEMHEAGELDLFVDRVAPDHERFMKDVFEWVKGSPIDVILCDSYRFADICQAVNDCLNDADCWLRRTPNVLKRGTGEETVYDIESAQWLIRNKEIKVQETKLMAYALTKGLVKENEIEERGKKLIKVNSYARIDILSAFVLACGATKRALSFNRTRRGLHVY